MKRTILILKFLAFLILAGFLLFTPCCASGVKETDLANEYYNIGNSYYNTKKYTDACRYYERALAFNPSFTKAKYNLAMASIKIKKTDRAIVLLKDLLGEDSENIDILSTLVYLYYETGEYQKAFKLVNDILAIYPDNSYALYNGGILLWKLGKTDEAIDFFIRLKENNPDDYDVLYNLGGLYYQTGEYEKAVECLEQFSEKKSDDGNTYLLLARSYTGLERYAPALKAYDLALSIYPELKEVWFEKAVILLTKVMDPEEGLASFSKALELGFNDTEKIASLLNDSQLSGKEKLELLLKDKNLIPVMTDEGS
jgi:tetratricopeptide (TPR) repeat protein